MTLTKLKGHKTPQKKQKWLHSLSKMKRHILTHENMTETQNKAGPAQRWTLNLFLFPLHVNIKLMLFFPLFKKRCFDSCKQFHHLQFHSVQCSTTSTAGTACSAQAVRTCQSKARWSSSHRHDVLFIHQTPSVQRNLGNIQPDTSIKIMSMNWPRLLC